jgi:flagellar basal-body rod modification protein FlgD
LQAGSLVDRSVLTQGNYANLSHQSGLSGELNLESSGSDVQVRVYDSVGALVKTLKLGMQPKGELPFKWDGSMDAGGTAPEGTYRIEADYYDGSSRQPLSALVSARVNSVVVQGTGQGLTLNLDGLGSVPFSKVSRIQ